MGYFKTIPFELEECALIDGASRWQILVKIVLPLAIPGLISAFIFCFTLCWNEFIYALTFLQSTSNKTVPVAIVNEFVDGDIYRSLGLADGRRLGRIAAAGHLKCVLRRTLCVGDDRSGEGIVTPAIPGRVTLRANPEFRSIDQRLDSGFAPAVGAPPAGTPRNDESQQEEKDLLLHILVLGAAGMVGRKLTERLLRDGRLGKHDITRMTLQDVVAPAKPNAGFPVDIVDLRFRGPRCCRAAGRRSARRDLPSRGDRFRRGRA